MKNIKLTVNESQMVADNHNLIYGAAKKFNLSIDVWYDLLAIELCKSVQSLDPNKGKISTYYYKRVFGLILKEYRKSHTKKREHQDIALIDNYYQDENDLLQSESRIDMDDWIKNNDSPIIRMRIDGYTQEEIAKALNTTQASVSRELKKAKISFKEFCDLR